MDILSAHEQKLIELLAGYRVRFVIVGGLAVHYYIPNREIKDVDLLVEPVEENIDRLAEALNHVGIKLRAETLSALASPKKQLPVGPSFPYCEIITSISGVDFDGAISDASKVIIGGYEVAVLSKRYLILSKQHRGERKDLEDIEKLREIT